MRFRILTVAVCFASAVIMVADAPAQFLDDAADVTDLSAPDPSESASEPDELVRQLESTAGRGGVYRAQAISSLARLGAWPQVDRWVARLDTGDDAEVAKIAGLIGPDLLLRISLRDDLSDASRSTIKRLFEATKSINQDPVRLRAAVAQLISDDVDANLSANRTLMAGGNAAIAEMVSSIAQGIGGRQRTKLLAVLKALGNGGAQSLNQLALYGDASVRAAALDALQLIDRDAALDTLLAATFAIDASPAERAIAQRSSMIPAEMEKQDAIAMLASRLNTLRAAAIHAPNDLMPVTLWSVDAKRTGVQPSRSTEIFQHYRDAYDAAQRLRRIGGLPPSVQRNAFAADLGYRVMVDVDWGDREQLKLIRSAYDQQLDTGELLASLAEQRRREEIPAAVGLLRLLSDSLRSVTDPMSFLVGRPGRFSELVDAVRDPQPRIRYEAAAIIANLVSMPGGSPSFAGATYFRKTLAEMASLQSAPTAIVLETRPVIALRQEAILGQLGYEVRTVTSASQLEREIDKGGDFRMVLSKIRIADGSPAELVDRIRRQPKGSRIPIVFYSDAETSEKSYRNAEFETTSSRWISDDTPAVYLVALPGSPAALADVLSEVESKRRLEMLSIGDRSSFQRIGTAALQRETLPH